MTRTERAEPPQALLARRIRSLSDVELDEGQAAAFEPGARASGVGGPGGSAAGRDAVNAMVDRHVGRNMAPAALAVAPEAFETLLAALPQAEGPLQGVRRTVSLTAGDLAESLDAALSSLAKGAAEVQIVLTAESFAPLEEDPDPAFSLLRDLKLACGPRVPLKVLFQGREFAGEELLAEAVDTALQGGADMIGLDLESLSDGAPDAVLDAALRLTALLSEADRPVGLKLRGGRTALATLDEAAMLLRLAARFLGSSHPDASQLRFAGPALDDAVLTLLRQAEGSRRRAGPAGGSDRH